MSSNSAFLPWCVQLTKWGNSGKAKMGRTRRRNRSCSQSPVRTLSRSPRHQESSQSPTFSDHVHTSSRSRSPIRRSRSRSPICRSQFRTPIRRSRSRSPIRQYRSRSPICRSRSRSPICRSRSRSPIRRSRSRSPICRYRSRSPFRRSQFRSIRRLASPCKRYRSPGGTSIPLFVSLQWDREKNTINPFCCNWHHYKIKLVAPRQISIDTISCLKKAIWMQQNLALFLVFGQWSKTLEITWVVVIVS